MDTLVDSYRELHELLVSLELPDEETMGRLRELVEGAGRIITVGAGRSGDVAETFMRFLRNLGYERSYGPDDIPYVIKYSDLLIAFTGSGATTYTLQTVTVAREAGVKIVVFTASPQSPAARMADLVVHVPAKTKLDMAEDYYERILVREGHAPLTPLGTLFELRSLLLSLAFIGHLAENTGVRENYENLLKLIYAFTPNPMELDELYRLLPRPRRGSNPWPGKTVVIGEGFSGIVARFFVTRFRHVSHRDEIREVYYWLDRGNVAVTRGDVALIISGSGEQLPALLASRAKSKGARVASVTSFPESTLGGFSDVIVKVPGRRIQRIKGLRSSYLPRNPADSIFELRTLILLEAFVYEVAKKEGITEAEMKLLHSDFT